MVRDHGDARGRRRSTRSRGRWPSASRAERHAALVAAPGRRRASPLRAAGGFQRRNFALAAAAAEAFLGRRARARGAARPPRPRRAIPGRVEVVAERPLTVYDGAHNPAGAHGAGGVARRGARRAAPARRGDRRARGQGRRRHARRAAAALRPRRVHPLAEPALAVAGHARLAGREARRAAGGDRGRPARGGRARARSWPARAARCSPPARST